jgi:hypothetical protein
MGNIKLRKSKERKGVKRISWDPYLSRFVCLKNTVGLATLASLLIKTTEIFMITLLYGR